VIGVPAAEGYPKAARLRRRADFLAVQRQGRARHTACFVVIQRPGPGPRARLGVTVSTRVGNAVIRNRIKRVTREVFRRWRQRYPAAVDVVVIAKPGARRLTNAEAATEIERALELAAAG
jgi:ribonuclease P protein component